MKMEFFKKISLWLTGCDFSSDFKARKEKFEYWNNMSKEARKDTQDWLEKSKPYYIAKQKQDGDFCIIMAQISLLRNDICLSRMEDLADQM